MNYNNSKHLEENNITYIKHMFNSLFYARESLKASVYFFIHAFFPDMFEYEGSTTIRKLNDYFIKSA